MSIFRYNHPFSACMIFLNDEKPMQMIGGLAFPSYQDFKPKQTFSAERISVWIK